MSSYLWRTQNETDPQQDAKEVISALDNPFKSQSTTNQPDQSNNNNDISSTIKKRRKVKKVKVTNQSICRSYSFLLTLLFIHLI